MQFVGPTFCFDQLFAPAELVKHCKHQRSSLFFQTRHSKMVMIPSILMPNPTIPWRDWSSPDSANLLSGKSLEGKVPNHLFAGG